MPRVFRELDGMDSLPPLCHQVGLPTASCARGVSQSKAGYVMVNTRRRWIGASANIHVALPTKHLGLRVGVVCNFSMPLPSSAIVLVSNSGPVFVR